MVRSSLFVVILILTASTVVVGQSTRTQTNNNNAWFMYFGNHKLSERTGLHLEAQLRRHDFVSKEQQLLLRTGVDFYLRNGSRLTAGYSFVKTYPYGEFAVANEFPEHRLWQQFLTTQAWGTVKLSHRYRLEQRWIGNSATGEFRNGRYENRFRYMPKITVALSRGDHPMFLAFYDEIFINFGKEVSYNIFDQNRLYGAVGFTISPDLKIEAGYLHQLVQQRSLDLSGTPKNKIESNHTLQLGIFSTMAFFGQ